jgi:hypothetical protein
MKPMQTNQQPCGCGGSGQPAMEPARDEMRGMTGSGKPCKSHRHLASQILRYPGLVIVRKPEDMEYWAELFRRLSEGGSSDEAI